MKIMLIDVKSKADLDAPQCRSACKVPADPPEGKQPGYSSARSHILFTMMSKPFVIKLLLEDDAAEEDGLLGLDSF